jgi:hypothetical protein
MLDMIKKFLPQNFNDFLALLLIFIIPVIWVLHGKGIVLFPESVTGALIATWTLIIQFYFRKKSGEK